VKYRYFDLFLNNKIESKLYSQKMKIEDYIPYPITEPQEVDVQFTDIFNIDEIQRLQDLFSNATGVASIIINTDGTAITGASNYCTLCQLVRSNEKGLANCIKSDAGIANENPTGIVVKQCLSSGLWDASVGININGKQVASWIIGQIRTFGVDIPKIMNYSDEIAVDREKYLEALNQVPFMSIEKFQDIAKLLALFTNEVSEKAYRNYQLKKDIEEQEHINELLFKSEETLTTTFNSIGDAVITTDTEANILTMNPIAEAMSGWDLADALGKPLKEVFSLISSKTNEPIENLVEQVIRTGKIIGLANHALLISKSGQKLYVSDSEAPIRNKDKAICGVVLVLSDVTEKHEAEEAIRLSELKYRGLINNLNTGVVVHAADTSIILNNPQASVILGLSTQQMLGLKAIDHEWKFVSENESPLALNEYPVNTVSQTKKPIKDQIIGIYRPETKNILWTNVNGFPIFNSKNEISQIVISFDDITTQKTNSDKLKEKELFLLHTQTIAKLGSYVLDFNSGTWESSEMLDEILGIESTYDKSVNGWLSIIHPEWQNTMDDYFVNEVVGNKQYFDKEYQILRIKDKSLRWVHGLGELIFDQKGELAKMVGTIQDITERKLNEEIILKSEEKYRSIFENIQDVFYQVELSGRIIEISPSAKAFGSFYDFTIPNQYIHDLYANPNDRIKFLELINKDGEVRDFELDLKGHDGTFKHVSINAKLIFDQQGNPTHIDGALRDISKRKIAQNALVESEKFLKEIQLIAHIGNWTVDLQQNTWICSEILDKIFGIDDSIEKNFKTLASIIHPESITELSDIYANEFSPSKTSFDKKFKIIRLNDKAVRWVHAIGELRFDENNRPKQMIGTVQDITLRKKDKEALRQSQEELKNFASHLQTVREEERNILAREIHDDLGQILIAMKIDLGLLRKSTLKTVREDNYNDLNTKFKTLSMLMDNTLMSARRIMTDLRPEVLDMIGFVEAVKQHLYNFQERTKINCNFETNTSKLVLNSEQSVPLFRIVQEALNNVSKHSRATVVNINFTQIKEELILCIEDNGIGFNQHETVQTQSYGLIGIRERVLLLDGELTLNSVKGNGTKLVVSIPYHKQETEIRNQLITNTNF